MTAVAAIESERLREALLDLERTRALQKRRSTSPRSSSAASTSSTRPAGPIAYFMISMIELRPMLGFEEAFFLAPDEGGGLRVTAATSPRFEGTRWSQGPMLRRAASGAPVSVFDVDCTEEWKALSAEARRGVKSALHVGLRAGTSTAFLACTHPEVGFFAERQRRLAEQLAPCSPRTRSRRWSGRSSSRASTPRSCGR